MKTRMMYQNGSMKEMSIEDFWTILTNMENEEQKDNFYKSWHFAPTASEWEDYLQFRRDGYRNR